MNNDINELFFELLRYSLDTSDRFEQLTISDEEWQEMYKISIRQTVVGVCSLGVRKLPELLLPPKQVLLRIYGDVARLADMNARVNLRAASACRKMAEYGFRACILKGQGNALMYPDKMVRIPGDIDLWVVVCDENGALRIDADAILAFSRSFFGDTHYCYHHVEADDYNETQVEIHYRPAFMNNLIHNRRLQRYFSEQIPYQFSNKEPIQKEGRYINVPTLDFNITYQMVHLSNHFFNEGLGLRQVIDYFFLLKKNHETGNKVDLTSRFRYLGVYKFATAVMWILHEVLSMPEDWMVVPANEKQGNFLLREIMIAGNFGKFDERVSEKMRNTDVGRNLQRVKRDLRLMGRYPSECMWEPVFRLWHWFWRLRHRLKTEK